MSDETTSPETTDQAPLRPRIGTVVWGSILLLVAAVTVFASQADFGDATPAAIVWSVVAFGTVLVAAGIVLAIVRSAKPRE